MINYTFLSLNSGSLDADIATHSFETTGKIELNFTQNFEITQFIIDFQAEHLDALENLFCKAYLRIKTIKELMENNGR